MKIINLSVGRKIYTSNVYLVTGDWNKLSDINTLIDVGRDPAILEKIDQASTGVGKKRIQKVVLTHSHYDHATLLPVIKKRYNPKTYAASTVLENIDVILKGGERLKIGDQEFEVIYTPGHSIDSICLYCKKEKVLFAGDTPLVIRTKDTTYENNFIKALEEIAKKEIETIYFGHGEPLKGQCKKILLNSLENARSQNKNSQAKISKIKDSTGGYMKTFANMKVKAKLLTGFIIMAIIVGVVGAVGITNIKALDQSDTELYENMTVPIAQAGQISTAFQRMRVNIRDMIVANDPIAIQANADKIAERQAELDTLTAEFEGRIVSEEMQTAFDEFVAARQNYKGSLSELLALANQNQDAQAFALMAESGAAGIAARAEQDAIAKLVELKLADGSAKATANTVQANSVVTTMIIVIMIGVLMAIGLGVFLGSTISKPLKKAAAMLKEMSMGHLGMRLKMDSKDEIGEMAMSMDSFADDLQNVVIGTMKQISSGDVSANIEIRDEQDEIAPALKETIETIRALIVEANMLSQAAVAGQLDTRGNADAFNGGYKEIVQGVNNTLDAVVGPLNVAAEYVERISKGDIPPKITDSYNGDFNEIKNNLNTCIDAITALVEDADHLAQAGIAGQLDTRADASKHGGDFAKIVDGVNNTLDAVIGPLNVAAEYVDRISKGDIPPKITDSYNGDFNEIKNNLNICIDAITALVDEATMLSQGGIAGKLNARGNIDIVSGKFKEIMIGVNDTLDALVGFIDVMPSPVLIIDNDYKILYMNDLGAQIAGLEKNDVLGKKCYNLFKTGDCRTENCACSRAMSSGLTATRETAAHPNGLDLDISYTGVVITDRSGKTTGALEIITDLTAIKQAERRMLKIAEYQQHETEKLVEGLTKFSRGNTEVAIVLSAGNEDTQDVHNTFQVIADAVNKCVASIKTLVEDANMLSQAAQEGRLDSRAEISRHEGDYAKIVAGINNTLDAVIGPLNVAAEYVDRISKGDIPPKITDSYNGDFNEIKNNLNICIDAITALVDDAAHLAQAGIAGQLDTRADASKHGGDFAKIVDGVNNTLDAVIGPLNVAAEYVDRISKGDIPPKITDNYNGDFNEIKNNLNTCIDAITALVEDADHLAQAGIAGQLDTRADASKHHGDFAKIVEGVNHTLDAVIEPINEASITLKELANGNLNTSMKGQYKGDHALIKEDMNRTVNSLNRYVKEITGTLEQMGRGNLDQEIKSDYQGDFLDIKIALNDITSQLSATMADIDEAAGQVEAGARQISDGGQALSQGTTEQASSIEQINASISEVAEETKKNAINANEANELAVEVRTNAEVGNGQMDEMVSAMIEINESSQNISKIIKVIDDIAFQTNILALNAAVEAARAGQHGKGFAVVAEEVRTLAARSAEAAKETTGLIEGSINKVEIGTKIADQTAISLKEILSEIERVADLVGNIAHASNEQASEIAQITQAINQVSQVVQTNSATAEESAAASEELSSQSEILMEMVGAFQLKENPNKRNQETGGSKRIILTANKPAEPKIVLNDMEYGEIKVDQVRLDKY